MRVGADPRDKREPFCFCLKGESRYPLGCFYVHGVKSLLSALDEKAYRIHDGKGTGNRRRDGAIVICVRIDRLDPGKRAGKD
jgi:hypothetical protein